MDNAAETNAAQGWKTPQVYGMAVVCLVIGLTLGYLFRGSATEAGTSSPVAEAAAAPAAMPSLDDMKRMADKQAEPLLAKLKAEPGNSNLLNQIGMLYKVSHQFKDAAGYFQKAVEADPKNVAARTDLASCLFYQGDADGAISQLQQALHYEPKDVNSLFNLGTIRLQAKNDPSGAIAAWQQLLKLNPTLPEDKKSAVQKLIARARQPKASE